MTRNMLSAAVAAALCISGGVSAAPVFSPFTVNTSSIPDSLGAFGTIPDKTFVATQISGTYDEKVAISSSGVVQAAAVATFDAFTTGPNGSTPISTSLGGLTGLGSFYSIYAIFTSTAQVINPITFGAVSGSISIYMDPGVNTTFNITTGTLTGGAITSNPAVSVTGMNSDDYLLATSSTMSVYPSSFGNLNPPPSFEFVFTDFLLTTSDQLVSPNGNQSGASLFTSPNPFYMSVRINGDIPSLTTTPNSLQPQGGKVSATFGNNVPEPGSLALMGLALAGLGLTQRRRKATS